MELETVNARPNPCSVHVAMSVDIDRFDDRYIRRNFLSMFRDAFGSQTPRDVRQQCQLARLQGLEVFPPCDHVDARGRCKGHAIEKHTSRTEET